MDYPTKASASGVLDRHRHATTAQKNKSATSPVRHDIEGDADSCSTLVDDEHESIQKLYQDETVETLDQTDSEDDESSQKLDQADVPLLTVDNAITIDQDECATGGAIDMPHPAPATPVKAGPVSWMSLPRKDQLAILTLARLSEPLTQTSLQSYMYYQLRSFSPEAPDSTISYQAGLLQAAFTGAQFCTAILWGRMADSERMGRKSVILIGLLGTAIGAVGFGFSRSFAAALCWRCLGGALNGNIGVMRTMISEIVREKKYQSRAFLLLPMTFNIGVIVGPLLGGLLADPVGSYPGLFGAHSVFGGDKGVWFMRHWPYALPNLVSAVFLLCSATALFLGLEESLEALRDRQDLGIRLSSWVSRTIFRRRANQQYETVPDRETNDIEMSSASSPRENLALKSKRKLPFRRIWTRNVLFTFFAHGMLACHVGVFNSMFFVFMSTPRYTAEGSNESLKLPPDYHPRPPFSFTGGLALPPPKIGTALAILGFIGISLQLLLYPRLSFRLGTVLSFRSALCLFPLAYSLIPFLAVVPTTSSPPAPAAGIMFWVALTCVLFIQVLGRTFALPATAILVNNSCPHPSVLGTIHGMAQSVSSATRTIGPIVLSWLYGVGLSHGYVGLAWWCMGSWAILGAIAGSWVREGDGHEIWLEGEKEEEMDRNKG